MNQAPNELPAIPPAHSVPYYPKAPRQCAIQGVVFVPHLWTRSQPEPIVDMMRLLLIIGCSKPLVVTLIADYNVVCLMSLTMFTLELLLAETPTWLSDGSPIPNLGDVGICDRELINVLSMIDFFMDLHSNDFYPLQEHALLMGNHLKTSRGMTAGYEDAWRNRDVLQKLRARKEQIVTGAGYEAFQSPDPSKKELHFLLVHAHQRFTVFIQQQDEVISNQITAVKLARKCLYHDLSDPDKKAEQRVRRTQMKKQLDVSCGKQWLSRLWQQRGG